MIFPRTLSFGKGHVAGWKICTTPYDSVGNAFANWSYLGYQRLFVSYLNYNYNYMQCSKPWDFLFVKNLRRVHSVHLYLPRSSSTYWIPWKWQSGRCAPRPKAPGFCHASARRDLDKWNLHRLITDPQNFKFGKCISTSKYDYFGICSVRKMYLPSNWKSRKLIFTTAGMDGISYVSSREGI